jgi:ParB family chromosome partitioning protein
MVKPALGRGLGALITPRTAAPAPIPGTGETVQQVPVNEIVPSPFQPRSEFREEMLKELTESIREKGIIQPLIVRRVGDRLELIAGERRWRAARQVGLEKAPVIVREASDQDVLELALIENLQREDLNPIEEARAYQRLASEFRLKQEDISHKVGKSREAVANSMRLLELHGQIQTWLVQRHVTVGHAKVLLSVKAKEEQLALAEELLKKKLTVRALETLVSEHLSRNGLAKSGKAKGSSRSGAESRSVGQAAATHELSTRLTQHLSTRVHLSPKGDGGRIEIEYTSLDQLDRILRIMGLRDEF